MTLLSATLWVGCASSGNSESLDYSNLPMIPHGEQPQCPFEELERLTYGPGPNAASYRNPDRAMENQAEIDGRRTEIKQTFLRCGADAIVERYGRVYVFIRNTERC